MAKRFDGKVAVITGAGRGVGRAEALLLASLGAKIVVNDLGATIDGANRSIQAAQSVVDEIRSAGGDAIADMSDVSTDQGARAAVARALENYGHLDILICNAGTIHHQTPPSDMTWDAITKALNLMVSGVAMSVAAAWDSLTESGAGRILLTSSTGILGLEENSIYVAAKGGVHALTRSLSLDGAKHGIKVNAICPMAFTRLFAGFSDDEKFNSWFEESARAEYVAPMAAYLTHSDCEPTGRTFIAGIGHVSELFVGMTPGWSEVGHDIDDIAANFDRIVARTGSCEPRDGVSCMGDLIGDAQIP